IVQGLAELLPVSSSAHVIVAAELMHENMSTPNNALLLVLLHTGTMFAVIVYFWRRWAEEIFASWEKFWRIVRLLFVSTLLSGLVFLPIDKVVEHVLSRGGQHADIEALFNKLNWIAPALAAAGVLILYAGLREARRPEAESSKTTVQRGIHWLDAIVMGILQGIAIPFRGFSRSGATISGGLLTGGERSEIEWYSFAMVVVITPLAIVWELRRVYKTAHLSGYIAHWGPALTPGIIGMIFSFAAGLLALKWLSRWLESGRWYWFGVYCLLAAGAVAYLYHTGY
ncbi:MAG TPA: undecaprenyl-diphosphate phosphatase, partial [Candidatus Acidoferrales bacterium]|nr:undecaprenyl-diphosphate phosphatase [Candidatus Acidoferrales bacterium]